ncbi:MAG: MATE family efflux transporter [Oscillospiraceae bacterium]
MIRELLSLDDKGFYKKITAIAIPIALQNLINFGVSMMDTLMVGKMGEIPLSAAAAANNVSFLFFLFTFGIANGCGVLTAQYWGADDKKSVISTIAFMYRIVMVVAVIFAVVGIFFPAFVLRLFIPDEAVIAEGVKYLRIISVGFFFGAITNSSIGILRSVGTVKISVYVYSTSLVVNTFLNYCLIFGKFGFPAMGIEGAAIATVIARAVEAGVILVFLFKFDKKLEMRPRDLLYVEKEIVDKAIHYSMPVVLNEFIWGMGSMVISSVIGHLGREALSANSICSVLFQLAQAAMFGLSSAASAVTGQTVGSGNYAGARRQAKTFVLLSFIMGLFGTCVMLITRYPLINFYRGSMSPVVIEYAFSMSLMAAVLVVAQTVSMITMMGILRGGGDTKFVMMGDVMFMWVFAIPVGIFGGFILKLPVHWVYFLLKSDDILKAFLALFRLSGGKWLKDITR